MNFSPQMLAVLKAISAMRKQKPADPVPTGWKPGDKRKLVELAVMRNAQDVLAHQAKLTGIEPLTVDRQSWRGCENATKGRKVIWHGIKRAIDGEDPLPRHEFIEEQIVRFDMADETGILNEEILALNEIVLEKDAIIESYPEEFKLFKTGQYTMKYLVGEYEENHEHYQKTYEIVQKKAREESKLRKNYQDRYNAQRKTVDELSVMLKARTGETKSGGKRISMQDLSPDTSCIEGVDDSNLLRDYSALRDKAWEKMLSVAAKKSPKIAIYLVFYKFNMDIKELIRTKLPAPLPGVENLVFACFQPLSGDRQAMHKEAAKHLILPPLVFVVEGDRDDSSNVYHISSEGREIGERLHAMAIKMSSGPRRKFDNYDFIGEGFQQIWIERISA